MTRRRSRGQVIGEKIKKNEGGRKYKGKKRTENSHKKMKRVEDGTQEEKVRRRQARERTSKRKEKAEKRRRLEKVAAGGE